MHHPVEIENIEALRLREGIDDVELRQAVRGLGAGDVVRLTFLSGAQPSGGETLAVRITRVRGSTFRGELADRPTSAGLAGLRAGAPVTFTADHIHSISKGEPSHGR